MKILNLTPSYRGSIENPQFGGQKSKLSKHDFRGKFLPPLVFGTFWPPYPGLRKEGQGSSATNAWKVADLEVGVLQSQGFWITRLLSTKNYHRTLGPIVSNSGVRYKRRTPFYRIYISLLLFPTQERIR